MGTEVLAMPLFESREIWARSQEVEHEHAAVLHLRGKVLGVKVQLNFPRPMTHKRLQHPSPVSLVTCLVTCCYGGYSAHFVHIRPRRFVTNGLTMGRLEPLEACRDDCRSYPKMILQCC